MALGHGLDLLLILMELQLQPLKGFAPQVTLDLCNQVLLLLVHVFPFQVWDGAAMKKDREPLKGFDHLASSNVTLTAEAIWKRWQRPGHPDSCPRGWQAPFMTGQPLTAGTPFLTATSMRWGPPLVHHLLDSNLAQCTHCMSCRLFAPCMFTATTYELNEAIAMGALSIAFFLTGLHSTDPISANICCTSAANLWWWMLRFLPVLAKPRWRMLQFLRLPDIPRWRMLRFLRLPDIPRWRMLRFLRLLDKPWWRMFRFLRLLDKPRWRMLRFLRLLAKPWWRMLRFLRLPPRWRMLRFLRCPQWRILQFLRHHGLCFALLPGCGLALGVILTTADCC